MNSSDRRLGLTLPLDSITLRDHAEVLKEAEQGGYTDAWTGEVDRTDAFTPLALAATCTERMRLGTGIASVFTRGPALLAMTASAMDTRAWAVLPGRWGLLERDRRALELDPIRATTNASARGCRSHTQRTGRRQGEQGGGDSQRAGLSPGPSAE